MIGVPTKQGRVGGADLYETSHLYQHEQTPLCHPKLARPYHVRIKSIMVN